MQIFASGWAQSLDSPGEFLESSGFGKVIAVAELGVNNSKNDYGWTGKKAVIQIDHIEYLLDFPEAVSIRTDTGFEILRTDCGEGASWHPDGSFDGASSIPMRDLRH